jgi:hypothetical protein
MASSDIYSMKELPGQNPPEKKKSRRRRVESFDETVNKDVPATHRRRTANSGFRRFRHLMKKPEFSKKFWIIVMGALGAILLALIVWDAFLRYPSPDEIPPVSDESPVE